jgi:hypothetical protein
MTTPDALPRLVHAYLEKVRQHLRDLAPDERAELTAPVEQRLVELAERGGPADIERQFGRPAQLAADLRNSAGYSQPAAVPTGGWWLFDWFRERLRHPVAVAVIAYVSSLRPAWWAVRGYLVLGGVLAVLGTQKYGLHTIGYYNEVFMAGTPPHWTAWWAVIPLLAVVASIALGVFTSRLPPALRLVVLGLDLVAVVVVLAFPTWWMPPAGAHFAGLVN